jgi:outer membrane protein TolC
VADAQVTRTVFNYAPRVTLTASYTRQSTPQVADTFGGGNLVGTTAPPGPIVPGTDPLFAIDGSAFNFDPLPNQWYLNAGVVVPISDYLLNMTQALSGAKSAKRAAKARENAARVNAAANARLAYYDWVRAKLKVVEAEKSIKRAQAQLETLRDLNEAGRAPRADVLRQDAFVANTELGLRQAQTREAISRENLHVMMSGGKGPAPNWTVGEDVTRQRPGDEVPTADLDRLQQEAIQNRLEIESLEETEYALKQQNYVENTNRYPRVEGFGNLTYANPNPRYFPQENEWNGSWDVGIRMIWTLNDIGARGSEAKTTRAEIAKVRAQKQQIKDALRTEVLSAHRSVQEAHLAQDSAQRGLASAEASYQDRVKLFRAGKATSFDVLDAETTLVTARLNVVEAYVALRMARVRLDHALGRDLGSVAKSLEKREN